MSRSPNQIIDIRIDKAEDGHRPPQPARDQTSQQLSHSSDSSIPLFALYLRISEEDGRKEYELLKGETDSILVFCGLFSATAAALVMPSLTPSGNDTNASNDTFTSIFRNPSTYNSLWLYSLILSIDCALKALLLQRWANKPTGITSLRYSLPEQARMSAYFSRRIERANRTVRKLHFLILTSLMVFFLDLLFYLFFVSLSIFGISLSSIIFCSSLLFTTKKFLHSGSPHCTPFTQEKTQKQGPRFDDDVLKRILNMPISDDDLEQFMEAIPGFCASKIVDNPRRSLDVLGLPGLAEALIEFCNCTLSSNRISESVKARRLTTCLRVIEAADLSIAVPHILHLLSGNLSEVSRLVEIGRFLRPLRNGNVASLARGIIGIIISNAERNGRWFTLAIDELGVSEDVLHHYLAHGDSVLLANMIHITRHILHSLQPHPDLTQKSSSILSSLSKFDILNVLPELQRDFCDLWNEVVQQARSNEGDDNPFIDILVQIRHLYDILHGTDIPLRHFGYSTIGHDDLFHQPPPYPFLIPLCMPDHHPEPSAHTHEPCGSTTGGASQTITTTSDILSESSPGDVLDVSHNSTTTGMGISQGIADTSIPSMAESTTQSDNLPEGIIESASSTLTDALLPLNPQLPTIYVPNISSGAATPSTMTHRENDNEDVNPTILAELTHLPD